MLFLSCLWKSNLNWFEISDLHATQACYVICYIFNVQLSLILQVDPLEIMNAFAGDLHDLKEDVVLFAPVLCVIGENPRSSLLSSHIISAQAKQYCRLCKVKHEELHYNNILTKFS